MYFLSINFIIHDKNNNKTHIDELKTEFSLLFNVEIKL